MPFPNNPTRRRDGFVVLPDEPDFSPANHPATAAGEHLTMVSGYNAAGCVFSDYTLSSQVPTGKAENAVLPVPLAVFALDEKAAALSRPGRAS